MDMEKKLNYIYEWKKKNVKRFEFYINRNDNPELLDYFQSIDNKQAYILDLIRKDMKKNKK